MRLDSKEKKDILKDELLKESSKYKLFITITSKLEHNEEWWRSEMNKIKENLKIKYKMKYYFISIEIGETLKKLHSHIILDISNLDYSWLHKLLKKRECTCDIKPINDEHNLKDYITGGRDKDYKGWIDALMHLTLYKSWKERYDKFFLGGQEIEKSTPGNEIDEKSEPSTADSIEGVRPIREDNDIIKINKKIINELLKLIKNSEKEFLGFEIRKVINEINKNTPFAQKLRESYLAMKYYKIKQNKIEELLLDNSIKKLNRKEEMYTFLTRIYKKFINSFVDYMKVLRSTLDETSEFNKVVKMIALLKDRTIAMIVRHIIWIHIKYILGTKINKKTLEIRDIIIQQSEYDYTLGNIFSRWTVLWKGKNLLDDKGYVRREILQSLGSVMRDYIFTWLKPFLNVEILEKKVFTRDNLYVKALKFSINEEILKEFSYRVAVGGVLYDKMPMLCMPKNWKHSEGSLSQNCSGGYLNNGISFYKPLMFAEFGHDLEIKNKRLIDAINYVQNVPFVVNKDYLQFLKDINIIDILDKTLYKIDETGEITDIKRAVNRSNKQKLKDKKQIMDIASELEQYPALWYPIQLDFRARFYPIPEYLNYQGDKFARSMIDFYRKEKLDKRWFLLALATAYFGNLDMSELTLYHEWRNISKSLTFDDVIKSQMWLKAKEPFLFLRLIWEYYRIDDFDTYKSGLSVYFDTSASGLLIISLLFGEEKYYKDLNLDKEVFYYLGQSLVDVDEIDGVINVGDMEIDVFGKMDRVSEFTVGDIYTRIVTEFIEKYYNVNYCDLDSVYLTKKVVIELNDANLFNKRLLDSWNLDKKTLRKLFKKVIMTMNYGLTRSGIFDKLYEACKDLNIYNVTNIEIRVLGVVFYDYIIQNVVLMKYMDKFKDYIMKNYTKKHKPFVFKSTLRPRKIVDLDFSVLEYDKDDYDFKMTIGNRKFNKINFNRRATYKKTKQKDANGNYIYKYKLDKNGNKIEIPSNKYQYKEWLPNKIHFNNHINGIKPNFIHHFDALILYNILISMMDNDDLINIAFVHDSFGISLSQYNTFIYHLRKTLEFMFAEDKDWIDEDLDEDFIRRGNSWYMYVRNVVWPK